LANLTIWFEVYPLLGHAGAPSRHRFAPVSRPLRVKMRRTQPRQIWSAMLHCADLNDARCYFADGPAAEVNVGWNERGRQL